MKNKIYLAALFISLSCLTTVANAKNYQEEYQNIQQQEDNIIKYQKLIKEDRNNTKAHNDLGVVYLKLKRLEEAEKKFKEALETDRMYSMGIFLFGDIYTDAERYKDKILDFQKVIDQNNEFARSHNNLGDIRLVGKKFNLARKEYGEALKINPKYAHAHNGLGRIHEQLGELDKAIEEYKVALSLDENNTVANYNIGLAYTKKNDLEQSIPYLKKAKELYKQENNEGKEKYLAGLIESVTKKPSKQSEKIKTVSNTSEELKNTLTQRLDPSPEDSDISTTNPEENIQVASKQHVVKNELSSDSTIEEKNTEDAQNIKVLKVKTVNGEFLTNERSASLDKEKITQKVVVNKDPKNVSTDPLVGDWIFEYPK